MKKIMKSFSNEEINFKTCPSCGIEKSVLQEQEICQNCFKFKHYGIGVENNFTSYTIKDFIFEEDLDKTKNQFFLVTDFISFRSNLIKNINDLIPKEQLNLIVNKVDLIPKSISYKKIDRWLRIILKEENIRVNKIFYLSAIKNRGIDKLNSQIITFGQNSRFLGYSSVGKSTIIQSLAKLNGVKTLNLISHTIGTTKQIIVFNISNNINIIDYPGLINQSNNQNLLNDKKLKTILPNKEIRVKNLNFSHSIFLKIDDFFYIKIESKSENSLQLWFGQEVKIDRTNYLNFVSTTSININSLNLEENAIIRFKREDFKSEQILIVVGIGMLILPPNWLKIEIYPQIKNFMFYFEKNFFHSEK